MMWKGFQFAGDRLSTGKFHLESSADYLSKINAIHFNRLMRTLNFSKV